MAKIRQKVHINSKEEAMIRKVWSCEIGRWYFSISDIMSVLTDSVDARNYWKSLKNRLKTNHNQLVMNCNQLKMEASDGKSYLVDTADSDTILKIIQIIAPYNYNVFKVWFEHVEVINTIIDDPITINNHRAGELNSSLEENTLDELSTTLEPSIDIYQNNNNIIVQIMLAGVSPDKIIITANMHKLTIKGERIQNINNKKYLINELQWGKFYREINFDTLIDVDQIEATEQKGLINIKLQKIDQDKNRLIKIKILD